MELFGGCGSLGEYDGSNELLAEKCIQMHAHNFAGDLKWRTDLCVRELRIIHA